MAVSYKKLWKLLIDKDMKKKDLCAKAGIRKIGSRYNKRRIERNDEGIIRNNVGLGKAPGRN